MLELPMYDAPVERTDASRNRGRILAAAARLIERDGGACALSIDRIAAEAGVGKGTIFRRFGDRAGLFQALLSDRGAAFQERLIRGAPPLGPGAPAVERLLAFGPAYLAFVEDHGELMSAGEKGAGWHTAAPHVFNHTHLRHLIREAAPGLDADYVADVLLATLRADLVLHQRRYRGIPLGRLAEGWQGVAGAAVAAGAPEPV